MRRWRGVFLVLFVFVLACKVAIAATLSPFGDEAFYWQESLRPAWGYSDLPPLTAWLIGASEAVFGHGLLSMRLPFLVLGALVPWQVASLARRAGGAVAGWQAATFALMLPLVGSLGVLALPDVPLTCAILLATQGLVAALEVNRRRDWLVLGLGLALAWATHYRAAMAMLAGLVFLAVMPRGRKAWRQRGLWLAMAVASLGLLPIIIYNLAARGAGLAFQVVERNPWQFHADALVQPLEQAVACTPLLYVLLLWVLWKAWARRRVPPLDVFAALAGTFVVAYFILGLFADDLRFRAHWPLPAYVLLCAAVPQVLAGASGRWRRFAFVALGTAGLGLAAGLIYLALAASPRGASVLAEAKAFPSHFVGWRDAADGLPPRAEGTLLVADNFMLAAELRFAFGAASTVYTLDSPLNVKHGRAPQVRAWGLDEAALHAHAGASVLLAVDETALRDRDARDWLGSVCARVDIIRPLGRVDVFDGRRRFAFYEARAKASMGRVGPADGCVVWMNAWRASGQGDARSAQ
ncbi:glycosyltransferase family 39 protein [Luteibacter aegosomaticola]|uniref:glycosyltransferase family 39 protein n=1 Tax=Luteibacter aegosomaticola TaxID=2911538 RepID=UPI001FF7CBB8|nr:glycosyltransferase family 39 protein [Luteibacter aegosomaticola]UPG88607.1 glycosyltransferase family 39 protein [Luteibacter aegosomaticola]